MQTLALARKWRPKTFSEVVGQTHVVEALTHALAQQRLHHAYLFAGTRGVGKTTLGRIFAKALNCEQGVTPTPCGKCPACRAIDEGRFVDLIEIDAASRTKVEDTRELLDNVQFLPTAGRFKVYLIDEVHMLSTHSFNALLKTLEEPPEHVKFILATTDPHKLPITVLSRCLKFSLLRVMPATIAQHLRRIVTAEDIEADESALRQIAYHADGSVRDALSLLDQAVAQSGGRITEDAVRAMLGLVTETQLAALLDALAKEDGEALATAFEQLAQQGVDYALLLDALVEQFHLISLLQLLGRAAPDQNVTVAERFSEAFAPERVQLCYQTGLLGQKDLQWAPDARTAFEMTLLRMLTFAPVTEMSAARPKKAENTPEGSESGQKPPFSGHSPAGEKPTSKISGGPPLQRPEQGEPSVDDKPLADEAPLDDSPLVEPPTGEAALQGEAKQSRFAQMLAQYGGGPGKAAAETVTPTASAETAPPAVAEEAPDAPGPASDPVVEPPVSPVPSDWLSPAQWAQTIEQLGLDGLVRTLAEHCVAARNDAGWQLAVAPDQVHLRRSKGEALAERLGTVRWVEWPQGGETVAAWQQRQADERLQQARRAFVEDPAVRTIMDVFDARVIEASIQPKAT